MDALGYVFCKQPGPPRFQLGSAPCQFDGWTYGLPKGIRGMLERLRILYYSKPSRPPSRSRSVESIVAEAKRLGEAGVVEINLIAQDLTAYGFDLKPRSTLTHLLTALEEVEEIKWIRLMYAYPRSFPKGLIDLMANLKRSFHISTCPYSTFRTLF